MSFSMDDLGQSLGWGHERIEVVNDRRSGLRAVIAIHSTVLGPALGGLRMRAYPGGLPEALDDALRLSRAMTLKASAAGLDLGGGKCVAIDDGRAERRDARLIALAREIERLGGRYVTAEDMGTTTADMDLMAEHTAHVVGRSARGGVGGDPSPTTARTVRGAISAALEALEGDGGLEDRRVGVIGLGKVGGRLARELVGRGASVVAFDTDPAALTTLLRHGVEPASSLEELLARPLDVLAPCAAGGMIDERVAREIRCRVVCGAANNPLAGERAAEILAQRGVLYVPDFLANCGGLIHVSAELSGGHDGLELDSALEKARDRTLSVLHEARSTSTPPSRIAERHAWARIEELERGGSPPQERAFDEVRSTPSRTTQRMRVENRDGDGRSLKTLEVWSSS